MRLRLPADAGERTLLVLLLLATFLLVFEPGRVPLFEPDEGRYGEIPREMLATGDWVTPRLNGVLYFEKPPLYYWSVAASMAVLGPTELAVRLPGKLSAAGMVLLAAAFARRRYGVRTGLLAGLVLASSLLVVALARIAIIDPMVSLALSGAAFAFAAFAEGDASGDARRARRALYGFHVACAAAVLLKGLIGVVLPGGAVVFWSLLTGRWRTLARVFSPGPIVVFLALAVPWHVAMALRHPDFLQFYFVHEHFQRFATTEHHREGPVVYFVPVLLAGFLPWTAFFGRFRETWPGFSRAVWNERGTEGFLWMFSGLVFAFFSVSRSKLIPYVLPIWPALAVLLALGIERARARDASFRLERVATAALYGALFSVGVAYGFGSFYLERFGAVAAGACALAALLGGFITERLAAPDTARGCGGRRRGAVALLHGVSPRRPPRRRAVGHAVAGRPVGARRARRRRRPRPARALSRGAPVLRGAAHAGVGPRLERAGFRALASGHHGALSERRSVRRALERPEESRRRGPSRPSRRLREAPSLHDTRARSRAGEQWKAPGPDEPE